MMEKLLNDIINKFKNITQRNLENKNYDYLILDVENKEEFKAVIDFIIKNEINIDLLFFISARFKKKKLYIQISDMKDNKIEVSRNLKKIHNFFRINYNKNISFKKSSKHSVFFEGRNFLLNTEKESNYNSMPLNAVKDLNGYQILLIFSDNLNLVYKTEMKDEYKAL